MRIPNRLLTCALALTLLGPALTIAATLEVAPAAVDIANDGLCSLPEAIRNANADAQVDNSDCPAGSGADTVLLASGSNYTFLSADAVLDHNALPLIDSTLLIDGRGATLERSSTLGCVLDGNRAPADFRLLQANQPAELTLRDLSLRGGCADGTGTQANDGGAISFRGTTLTLERVTVEGNQAFDKSGGLDIDGTSGAVTIVDSSFRNNHGGGGAGAIGNTSPQMTIVGSTISGNSSGGQGGGGIGNFDTLTLRNSTVSGNSSTGQGGGGIGNAGVMTIENATIVGNSVTGALGGGGIGNASSLTIKNSIVAENGAGGDCVNLAVFNAIGQNLDSDGSCAAIDPDFTQVSPGALALAPLADNGGPTQTHAFQGTATSVAIDAVLDCTRIDGVTAINVDQRGEARPQDGDESGAAACDVGAFELARHDVHHVDGVTCTLGDAIEASNLDQVTIGGCVDVSAGPDTIVLYNDTVLTAADTVRSSLLAGAHAGLPDVSSQITITPGNSGVRIERNPAFDCEVADGPNEFRLLQVVAGGELTLSGLTLANGCADQGGAVLLSGNGVLLGVDSGFVGNTARSVTLPADGGAVAAVTPASMRFSGTLFQDNLAAGSMNTNGGALYSNQALVELLDSRFIGNAALAIAGRARGGAVRWISGAPTLERVVFQSNQARGADETGPGSDAYGGALYADSRGATLREVRFADNLARGGDGGTRGGSAFGGGAYTDGSNGGTVFQRVSFVGNRAEGGQGGTLAGGRAQAGALFGYVIELLDSTLSGNVAQGGNSLSGLGGGADGAGLYVDTSEDPIPIRHTTIAGNRVVAGNGSSFGTLRGGGLYLNDPIAISSSVIEGNTATVGTNSTDSPCQAANATYLGTLGYNTIAEASPDCVFDGTGDQTAAGPSLLPVGEYGCSTTLPDGSCLPTHPVAIGSPAHDAGSCSASGVTADARGYSRPWDDPDVANLDDGCDAGAYESRDLDNDGFDDDYAGIFANGFE